MERRNVVKWVLPFVYFLLVFSLQLQATNYYVSTAGNDLNSGTSPTSPWKTLAKVQAESSKFVAGDVIAFRGGDSFYGPLVLSNLNGNSDNPITITSYGTGKAIVTGSKNISGWTRYSGNIWQAPVESEVYQLFKNNQVLTNGRIPDIKGKYEVESNFHKVTSVVDSKTSFICTQLIGSPDITGATVHVSTLQWLSFQQTIKSFDSSTGKIVLTGGITDIFRVGNTFFINNHLNLLTKEGDWYYDINQKRVFLYSVATPAAITGAQSNTNGVEVTGGTNVVISNLAINHFNLSGIYARGTKHLSVKNCDLRYNYRDGIYSHDGEYDFIDKNTISGSNRVGFRNYNPNSKISGNTIEDIGLVTGLNRHGYIQGQGMSIYGENSLIIGNTIINLGYNGIGFRGLNITIENNLIKYFHLTTSDGGGIYTYQGKKALVKNNIVIGYPFTKLVKHTDRRLSQGIYIDNYTRDVTVESNTIINCEIGISLTHSTANNTVKNNTVYKSQYAGIHFTKSDAINPGVTNNVSFGNLVFTDLPNVIPLIIELNNDETFNWLTINHNFYFNSAGFVVAKNFSGLHLPHNLVSWQAFTSQEVDSKTNDRLLDNFSVETVYDSMLIVNGKFETDFSDWKPFNMNIELLKHDVSGSDKYLISTINEGASIGSFFTYTLPVEKGYDYVFEFEAKVPANAPGTVTIRHSDGTLINNNSLIYFKEDWAVYRIPIYNLSKSDEKLKITFVTYGDNKYPKSYAIDNVKLIKCKLNPDKGEHQIVFNDTELTKTIPLDGNWKDPYEQKYSGSILLPPYASKVLIRDYSKIVKVEPPLNQPVDTTSQKLGNSEVFTQSASSANVRAIPVISSKEGTIESVSIYHNGGTGNMQLAVFADENGSPGNLLGATRTTPVEAIEGWQTIDLSVPVPVTNGQTVWLSWLFEDNVLVRWSYSEQGRAQGMSTWLTGLKSHFGPATFEWPATYSIYCSYSNETNSVPPTINGTIGNTNIFSSTTSSSNLRAIPVTSLHLATIKSVSIYHNGGAGSMQLAVYADENGSPGNLLGSTRTTPVEAIEGWQTIDLSVPVPVTNGQTVWLSWLFEDNVLVRWSYSEQGRAQGMSTWLTGLKSHFGPATFEWPATYSIYCSYSNENNSVPPTINGTIGNTNIFRSTTSSLNLRAIPVTSLHLATIKSVSIYHNGGTGNMQLAVYADENGSPGNLLGSTRTTSVEAIEGWQTIDLSVPVPVTNGQTVWLSWLFEDNVLVRWSYSEQGRAQGMSTWLTGLKSHFGPATFEWPATYSVFCTFSYAGTSIISNKNSTMIADVIDDDSFVEGLDEEVINAFPNPTYSNVTIRWQKDYSSGVILQVYNMSGDLIGNARISSGIFEYRLELANEKSGFYTVRLIDIETGKTIGVKRISRL